MTLDHMTTHQATPPSSKDRTRRRDLRELASGQGVLIALVCVTLFLAVFAPAFFTPGNLVNVLRQSSEIGIVAAGMAVVILMAGIDLSVGSILAFAGVAAAVVASPPGLTTPPGAAGMHWIIAIFAALLAGAVVGLVNGLVITRAHVTAIIATLAMMTALRGLVLSWTGGIPVYSDIPEPIEFLGRGYVGPVPVPVILLFLVYFVLWILLYRTPFGRYVYAIGGNPEAARLSGISVRRYTTWAYVISGLCAGIAGLLLVGRLSSAQPVAGQGFELEAISAVALAGVSLFGGRGSLIKVLMAAVIIGMLSNGLVLMDVSPYVQMMVKGAVLAAAVAFDVWTQRTEGGSS